MERKNYSRKDGWLLVSVYQFGITLHNKYTGETVTVPKCTQ